MAVLENGRPTEHIKDRPNGHAVGHTTTISRRRSAPRTSWTQWLFSNLARLSIWYALLTIIFRCPSNAKGLTDTTPQICKPYLTTKGYVQPHLQPYYDTYAASHVEKARPYVSEVNKRVVSPVSNVALYTYEKYAAPQLEKAKTYGLSQWDQLVLPQVLVAQDRASTLYASNVEPHVSKASEIVTPYYKTAKDNAVNVHQDHLLPAIEYSKPHLQTAYTSTEKFLLKTALPFAQHAWSNLIIFIDGTLWPFVKGVYSDNVRPQVVMISERIAKYQEGRKIRAAVGEAEVSIEASSSSAEQTTTIATASPTDLAQTVSDFMASIIGEASSAVEQVSSSVQARPSRQVEHATDESIAEDLIKWQKKFAVAADKGTDDLRDRVQGIVDGLLKSDVDGEGKGLATALEQTTEVQIANLKSKILSVVSSIADDASASDVEKAEEDIMQAVRSSGLEIRDRAKKVRDWSQKFQVQVAQRTSMAADSTLQVLDSIRDLGLQEIGMRWAWMEGVTYKHWQKYHDLKQRFDEWRSEVYNVAIAHPAAKEAQGLAEQILEESMAVTEEAAKELFRLKDVAKWKIRARDSTDDFESRILPAAIVSAAKQAADLTSSLIATSQGTMDSILSQATDSASSLSSVASSVIDGKASDVQANIENLSEAAKDSAATLSAAVLGSGTGSMQSLSDQASSSLSSASSAILGTTTGSIESFASQAASSASSAVLGSTGSAESVYSHASSSISSAFVGSSSGSPEVAYESVKSVVNAASDSADDLASSVSGSASSAASFVSSRFFAQAQEVKGHTPILDDVFDDDTSSVYSSKIQSIVEEAGAQYADVTKALSEAIYGTEKGTVEKMTEIAGDQYSAALSAASSVLYGTQTPVAESISSALSDRYSVAVAAASSALYRPTPVTDSLLQSARSVYDDAMSRASVYSVAAASVVSAQISGTPQPIHSQMLDSISAAYFGAVDSASSQLANAVQAGSSQFSSLTASAMPTQGVLESISSVASARLQEALDAANSQYTSAKVAVGAEPAPLTMQAQQSYYAAIGYAHEQYSAFVSAGSSAVYGTPTPVYQQMVNAAASRYSAASSAASLSLSSIASVATSTKSPAQSVLEQASASYSSLLSVASASLLSASAEASIAILGTQAPAYQKATESIQSSYAAMSDIAAAKMDELLKSASAAIGKKEKSPAQSVLDSISSQYSAGIVGAQSSLSAASASVSSLYYGPEAGSYESIASVASENWEQLLSQASDKIYGTPAPIWASVTSIGAQATDAAAEQFVVVQAFVSELIIGSEPAFTESVMSRLSSQYYGIGASASSVASEVAASGASVMSSVSSVVSSAASSYFTPPAEINSILDLVNSQLAVAVNSASAAAYGTSKGYMEKAGSAIADSYSSVSSVVDEQINGTPVGYAAAATSSISDMAQSASEALSIALFGTTTGSIESASSVAAASYASITSQVSEALFGPEQGVLESAQGKIMEAVESARSRIAEFGVSAGEGAQSVISEMSSSMESAASVVSESITSATSVVGDTVSSVTSRIKDEL